MVSDLGTVLPRNEISKQGGCSCKFAANSLRTICGEDVAEFPEDCGVVPIGDQLLLSTVDFGPCVGSDMVAAGKIATFNALSDVYACGGQPLCADVVLMVSEKWSVDRAAHVESGVKEACRQDGVKIVGGHTIQVGNETIVGLSVTGIVDKGSFISKRGGYAGEILLMSKCLGVGLAVRGFVLGHLGQPELDEAVRVMTTSNREAAEAAVKARVTAMTDYTGFGFAGHLSEMLMGSRLGAEIKLSAIPMLECISRLPEAVARTKYLHANLEYVRAYRSITGLSDFVRLAPLLDPQTSGGLLVAADCDAAETLVSTGLFHAVGVFTDSGQIEIVE